MERLCGSSETNDAAAPSGVVKDGVLRNASSPDELVKYASAGAELKTLYDTFEYGVKRNPSAECLGKRKSIDSPYEWKTYKEIQSEVAAVGSYLVSLGIKENERVGLSGKNAPEYLTAIVGCFYAGITTVPIYDTFGETECKYIMEQAETQAVFVSSDNASKVLEWGKDIASLTKIIVWGEPPKELLENETVISFEEAVKIGREASSAPRAPAADDLAIIMYTSGTTGMPKGVMLPHEALVATCAGTESYFDVNGYKIDHNDVFMSYLPLAHVFDFFSENLFLFLGAKIGYYRGDQKTLVDDIGELKPTFFVGVPRVFERIYKRVDGMVQSGSAIKKFLFNHFFANKRDAMVAGKPFDKASKLGDKLVFSKVKARLGGNVRIICSGGAPLPHHVEEWLKVTMCCPVVQGYGLTETCGANAVALPDRKEQLGTVGPPMVSLECKLDPVPDMGYDGSESGGGEICFRGASVMKGYYQKAEATAEVLEADGWFHTGDIGKIVEGGCLKIVDRKKQLFKLSQGEYVSPERVEGIAAKSPLVGQIFVHGTSTEATLVAVVVPSEGTIEKYGGSEKCVSSEELKAEIVKDLDKVCRGEGCKGYEIPKAVILHGEEFTPESGFVTPSFKLKRPNLKKHFAGEIEAAYKSLNA
mmetsp:Transcript_31176/g.47738  ORF Transcript_31176/g.47738 Transcript_31176/m.47738 type:complete len:645 (-) Transcript_31176:194-2128(-)